MQLKSGALALLGVTLVAGLHGQRVQGQTSNVVHYTTTLDNVKYLFATADPVARLKSGDILETNTLDCFGNALRKPGDTLSMSKGDNPLAGPFLSRVRSLGTRLPSRFLICRSMATLAWAHSLPDLAPSTRPTTRPCSMRRFPSASGSITSITPPTPPHSRRSILISP